MATAAHKMAPRRAWFTRTSSLLAAAVIVAVTLWVAGIFPPAWLNWLEHKFAKHDEPAAVATAVQPKAMKPTATPSLAPPAPIGNDSSISDKPLALILTGTMPGQAPHEGQAFIGVHKDSPQTYQAGALLANGARIAAIYTDHVVLEKNGRSVDLYLDGAGKRADSKALDGLLTVGGSAPPPMATATTREVLTDYIRPSPLYDGEILRGYQVYAGQKSGVFSQMGLQAGDVITSINGVPLTEPQSAIEQFKQLTDGVVFTATVERKDGLQVLSLDGALIVQDQQRAENAANASPINMPPM